MRGEGGRDAADYRYESAPTSVVSAFLARAWYRPMLRLVPARIPADALSLAGTLAAVASLGLCLLVARHPGTDGLLLVAAALYWAYHTLDNLDGPQARRRGTSGPRGEFLDHGGDALTTWTPILALGTLADLPDWALVGLAGVQALAFWGTLWRHHVTGVFDVRPLSDAEPALLVTGLLVAAGLGGRAVLEAPILVGLGVGALLAIVATLGALVLLARCTLAADLDRRPTPLPALLAVVVAGSLWSILGTHPPPVAVGAGLVGTALAGASLGLLRARLEGTPFARLDAGCVLVTLGALAGIAGVDRALGVPSPWPIALLGVLVAWRVARLARTALALPRRGPGRTSGTGSPDAT